METIELINNYDELCIREKGLIATFQNSEVYKDLMKTQEDKIKVETELKNLMKQENIEKVRGKVNTFLLELRPTKSRKYDIKKILENPDVARLVTETTVNDSMFKLLEKADKIPNATDYYTAAKDPVKAVLIRETYEVDQEEAEDFAKNVGRP